MNPPVSTKEDILHAACLLFAEHGYDGVSMRQIATAANIHSGSLHYHFDTKENLYSLWIVAARRDQHESLRDMPILSWDERFGVLRLAPLARWRQCCIDHKIRREAIPCDLFLDREEFILQATSVGERDDDTDDETKERGTARFSHAELCCG